MPISYTIDSDQGVVYALVEGTFTLEEMLSTIGKVVQDPKFRKGFAVLSDHRSIVSPATTNQVQSLVRHARQFEILAGTKWAIVTTNDLSFGMMRMFSALAETIPMRIEVFRDYDEALAWLKDKGALESPAPDQ